MNIKIDSRKIIDGDTFIALRGVNDDGHNYINDAIKMVLLLLLLKMENIV